MSWKLLSFVSRSEQRRSIIMSLVIPKTPSKIAKETKLAIAHVSRSLREFEDKGIVECKTPKEKVGRIYVLTKDGKDILKKIK